MKGRALASVMKSDMDARLIFYIHTACSYRPLCTPQEGRDITYAYYGCEQSALGGLSIRARLFRQPCDFRVHGDVDGIFVNGVDMITFENDQIVEFKVMVRPLRQ